MISVPQRRTVSDEFLADNNIDVPTSTTIVDNGDNSIIIHEGIAPAVATAEESQLTNDEIHDLFDNQDILQQAMDDVVKTEKYALPVNTVQHVDDDARMRFSGANWFNEIQKSSIILAGLGGIGSNVLYNLSRMNPKQIFIYDDDSVEEVNLAGQMYSMDMIGMRKVDAMNTLAINFSNYHGVQAIAQKFTADTSAGDVMICGFDNMAARKVFFNSWQAHVNQSEHKENCLFIDGRLAMEDFQVFCIRGDDDYSMIKYRREQLFSDSEAEETICSMKQTAYCANMIGSVIVNLFTNFVANKLDGMPRPLPYFTYYDASLMYFKTEL